MSTTSQQHPVGDRKTTDAKSNQRQASRNRDGSPYPHKNGEFPRNDVPKRRNSQREAVPMTTPITRKQQAIVQPGCQSSSTRRKHAEGEAREYDNTIRRTNVNGNVPQSTIAPISQSGPKPQVTSMQRKLEAIATQNGKDKQGEVRGRSPVRRSSVARTMSAQSGDQGDDSGGLKRSQPKRSSSAHGKDKDRSRSRTREIFRRKSERAKSSNRLGLTSGRGITDSIVYAKINSFLTSSKEVQVRATKIEGGKWKKASAIYLRVEVEMTGMTDAEKVVFRFHFTGGKGPSVDVHYFSPETLLGVAQPVQEGSGRELGGSAEAGKLATAGLKGLWTKSANLTRDHQPRVEVKWMNGALEAHLLKTGNKCPTPSSFELQMVVDNEKGGGFYIACDVDVPVSYARSAKGTWKKVVVAKGDSGNTAYDEWKSVDWEKNGGCERFQKNATVW